MIKIIFITILLSLSIDNPSHANFIPYTNVKYKLVTTKGIFEFNSNKLLISKQKKYEKKIKIKNFKVRSINYNNIHRLIIDYNDHSLLIFNTAANPLIVGTFIQLPLNVTINDKPSSIHDLIGKRISKLKYSIEQGSVYIMASNIFLPIYQFNIIADITPTIFIKPSKTSKSKKIKEVEYKGFIYFINKNESTITISKKGVLLKVNITPNTILLIDGIPSTFLKLQLGHKVKLKYDNNTKNVSKLSASFKLQ